MVQHVSLLASPGSDVSLIAGLEFIKPADDGILGVNHWVEALAGVSVRLCGYNIVNN